MPTNTRCRIPHHALVGIDFLSLIPHKLPFQPFHMPEVDHKHRSTRKQPGRHIHIHQHLVNIRKIVVSQIRRNTTVPRIVTTDGSSDFPVPLRQELATS